MANEWFYRRDDQQHGPISSDQLKELAASGEVRPTDIVWKEGLPQWIPAAKLKGLSFGEAARASVATKPRNGLRSPVVLAVLGGLAILGAAYWAYHSFLQAPPTASRTVGGTPERSDGGQAVAARSVAFPEDIQGEWIDVEEPTVTIVIGKDSVVLADVNGSFTTPCTMDAAKKTVAFASADKKDTITASKAEDGKLCCKFENTEKTFVMRRKRWGEGMKARENAQAGAADKHTSPDATKGGDYKFGYSFGQNIVGQWKSTYESAHANAALRATVERSFRESLNKFDEDRDAFIRAGGVSSAEAQRCSGICDAVRDGLRTMGIK